MKELNQEEKLVLIAKKSYELGAIAMLTLIAESESWWPKSKEYYERLFKKLNK